MATDINQIRERPQWPYFLAALGALLIVAVLVWVMDDYTRPPDLNAKRAAERARANAELQAQSQAALESYGWVDQPRGIVRLPIERAMQMTAQAWREPAAARSNLLQRVDRATAKLPEKPNPYE